jgi:protein O-GlcNAc transferase
MLPYSALPGEASPSPGELRVLIRSCLASFRSEQLPQRLAEASQGLHQLGHDRFALALAEHAQRLSGDRGCDEAQLVLARLAMDRGELSRALGLLLPLTKTAIAFKARLNLVGLLRQKGQAQRALALLERGGRRHPTDHRYALGQGQLLLALEKPMEALAALQRCLALQDNCTEALRAAYLAARGLKQPELALSIAIRLNQLEPEVAIYHALHGLSLWELDRCEESREPLRRAAKLAPRNLIHGLNAAVPVWRVPPHGGSQQAAARQVVAVATKLRLAIEAGERWQADGGEPLLPLTYFCAYSPLNMRELLEPFHAPLHAAFAPLRRRLRAAPQLLKERLPSATLPESGQRRIRLGLLSANFSSHSNLQAFSGLIHHLNRQRFELILIHSSTTVVDQAQLEVNGLADQVVYLHPDIRNSEPLLRSLALDILFFTDRGFSTYDFVLPDLRTCGIQITGWGVPHTSGLGSIDYYLSSALLEGPEHQAEYSEQLVLLDGLPGCLMAKDINYRLLDRNYFFLPNDRVILGCLQNCWKIHPDFDLLLERIARRLPEALFVFVDCGIDSANQSFQERLARRAPRASEQVLFLARCATADFLSLCDCLDLQLDTPYYGAGVTAYLSMYVGTPTVALAGHRLRDRTVAAIYRYLKIENAPVAGTFDEYVEQVVDLAMNPARRLALKKATVAAAHRLYDNQEYVRSFERFCESLLV